MITIKCNEQEKEMFERLFCRISNGNIDCNDLDLHCDCCPSKCSGSKEVEYQVENSNSKLVYISGAITGVDNYLDTFKQSESHLKSLGYETINPAKILSYLPKSTPYETYMNMSYEMLKTCDAIYMMEGWEDSKGARLELDFAKEHKIKELKLKESFEVRNNKKYEIAMSDCFNKGTLRIAPNCKTYTNREYSDSIYFSVSNDDAYDEKTLFYGLTKQQAKEIIDALSEVLETIEEGEN